MRGCVCTYSTLPVNDVTVPIVTAFTFFSSPWYNNKNCSTRTIQLTKQVPLEQMRCTRKKDGKMFFRKKKSNEVICPKDPLKKNAKETQELD